MAPRPSRGREQDRGRPCRRSEGAPGITHEAPPRPVKCHLQLAMPQIAIPIPFLDQAKLMKLLFPFIDLGKGVALGTIRCS